MSSLTALIIFLVLIVLIVLASQKLRINAGFLAIACAFLFGKIGVGLGAMAIIGKFPTSMFFNMFIVTMFFGYSAEIGATKKIGENIVYKFRNHSKLMPLILFVVAFVISTLGAGADAGPVIISPLLFAVALEMGFDPLLACIACNYATSAGACQIWSSSAPILAANLGDVVTETQRSHWSGLYAMCNLAIAAIIMVVAYFLFKGWKHERELTNFEKPEPFTDIQKKSISLILGFVFFLLIPRIILLFAPQSTFFNWFKGFFDYQTLAAIGIILNELMHIADGRKVLSQKVPWAVIISVCGMITFINVFLETGFVEMVEGWLTSGIAPVLIMPLIIFLGGFISMFTSFATVQPIFCAMMPAVAAASGIGLLPLLVCVAWSGQCTSISPFSQGGSMALIGCHDNELREKLFTREFKFIFIAWGISIILALLGFFRLFV